MATRICVLGDVHGNELALEAALVVIARERPDLIVVTGDLVLHGPRPSAVVRRIRELEQTGGAIVVQGNTDIAVADLDFSAAFPWLEEVAPQDRSAAEWAHDALADDELDWLRRLPAERRVHLGEHMVLVCHASPGSQTSGLPADLDPSVTVERVTRTDARVIACGHTHAADVRELGRKLICNPGSCGYSFDGDPGAGWAMLSMDGTEPRAELFRASYDAQQVATELSERGLPGDVYRAATVRTGRSIR